MRAIQSTYIRPTRVERGTRESQVTTYVHLDAKLAGVRGTNGEGKGRGKEEGGGGTRGKEKEREG